MGGDDINAIKKKGEIMGEAVKLWDLPQGELIRERLEAIQKQKRNRVAEVAYALDEGREEGGELRVRKVAIALLQKGVDLNIVSSSTGLSKKELEMLQKSLKR